MVVGKNRKLWKFFYKNYQKNILLAYRPTLNHTWGDRATFLGKDYNPKKEYNHRMILNNEIVFEYDFDDLKKNKSLIDKIAKRLDEYNIAWCKWYSGGKSYHLHCNVNTKDASDLPLFKRAFTGFFTRGLPNPDMQMCGTHLIRAEYGVNEKTGKTKRFISKSKFYPKLGRVPQGVWDEYTKRKKISIANKANWNTKDIVNSKEVRMLLNTIRFKEKGDGRERALWVLIHVLKGQYKTREELTEFLQDWYKYSGGSKLSNSDIAYKIRLQYNKNYTPGITFISNLLAEVGVTDEGIN